MNTFFKIAYQPYKWLVVVPSVFLVTMASALLVIIMVILFGQNAGNAVAVAWARFCCMIVPIKVHIVGKKNYDKNQSYVLVANHQSMADIPILHGWLGLNIKWVMKKELSKVPIFGPGCEKLGCIAVDRSNHAAAIESIEQAKLKLSRNASVLFFAEGSRSRDGEVMPFKKGAFRFAADIELPILPITIKDSIKILPSDSTRLFPGIVTIVIHPPINANRNKTDINALVSYAYNSIKSAI